jgi:hypothetical protein
MSENLKVHGGVSFAILRNVLEISNFRFNNNAPERKLSVGDDASDFS